MKTIIQKAFQVVAWPGAEDECSIRAFEVLTSYPQASLRTDLDKLYHEAEAGFDDKPFGIVAS